MLCHPIYWPHMQIQTYACKTISDIIIIVIVFIIIVITNTNTAIHTLTGNCFWIFKVSSRNLETFTKFFALDRQACSNQSFPVPFPLFMLIQQILKRTPLLRVKDFVNPWLFGLHTCCG